MMMRPLTDTSFAGNGIARGLERRVPRRPLPRPNHATGARARSNSLLALGYYRYYETHDFLIKIFTAALIGSVN